MSEVHSAEASWQHQAANYVPSEMTEVNKRFHVMEANQQQQFHQAVNAIKFSEHRAMAERDNEIASLELIANQEHDRAVYLEQQMVHVARDMRAEVCGLRDELTTAPSALHRPSDENDAQQLRKELSIAQFNESQMVSEFFQEQHMIIGCYNY